MNYLLVCLSVLIQCVNLIYYLIECAIWPCRVTFKVCNVRKRVALKCCLC